MPLETMGGSGLFCHWGGGGQGLDQPQESVTTKGQADIHGLDCYLGTY